MKTYTTIQNDIPRIINNSLADNLTWATELVMDSLRYLVTKYYFNERTYTVPGGTIAQTQFYNLPPQVKKLINLTVTIGGVKWTPKECPSREMWDKLNVITFYQDFPSYFFVYNGQVGIWPIPASAGNTVTMNFKTRIIDLSQADVTDVSSNAAVQIQNGTTNLLVAGLGTTVFYSWMNNNYIRIPYNSTNNASSGDNQWYQISNVISGTQAVLANQYSGATVGTAAFLIGEVPILPEDYQDLPLYRMGEIYYSTRFPDPSKAQLYHSLWDAGVKSLDDEFGSKTSGVILNDTDAPISNPNLFQRVVG